MSSMARFGIAAGAVLFSVGVALVQLVPPADRLFTWRASYFETLTENLAPHIQKRAAIPVRLVAIDAETIRRSGEAWPWPEERLHAFTRDLQALRPRLLLVDLGASTARPQINRWSDIALDPKLEGDAQLIAAGLGTAAAAGSWPLIVLRDGTLRPSFELATALTVRGSDRARMIANVKDLAARFERRAIRGIATEDGRGVWATASDGSVRILPEGAPTGFRATPAWKVIEQDTEAVRGLSGSVVVVKRAEADARNPAWQGTQALAQLVNGLTPGRPPWAVLAEGGLAAAAALFIALLMLARRRVLAVVLALLTAGAAFAASVGLFAFHLELLDPIAPSLLMLPALFIGALGSVALGPPKTDGQIQPQPLRVVGNRIRGAERREVTALVCKIRELDLVAETFREQPEALSQVVSRLLTTATEIASAHEGTIETASASGLVVLFNAPAEDARHAEHATEAALAMLARLEPLNQDFEKLFKPGTFSPFNFSIGIETGDALVGELGLRGKGELSALGPAIDTASLLAGRARTYGPAILVGAQAEERLNKTFALLQIDIAEIGAGERKPFYALMGNPVLRANPRFKALQLGFDAFHNAYRKGSWDQAGALLAECAKLPGANPRLVALFERRLAFLKERPADPAWTGILRVPVE